MRVRATDLCASPRLSAACSRGGIDDVRVCAWFIHLFNSRLGPKKMIMKRIFPQKGSLDSTSTEFKKKENQLRCFEGAQNKTMRSACFRATGIINLFNLRGSESDSQAAFSLNEIFKK